MDLSILQIAILFLKIAVIFLSFQTSKAATVSPSRSTSITDQLALIAFKSAIFDPHEALSSWTNASADPCNWKGVTCGPTPPKRVTSLNLQSLQLEGYLSPSISNITFLRHIDLSYNQLHGIIPQELGFLSRLQVLNLTMNLLQGEIPPSLSSLPMLTYLRLDKNNLSGVIPTSLGNNNTSLIYVCLRANKLSGAIPLSLANNSALEFVDLSINLLTGGIPASVSTLPNLIYLDLSSNNLVGRIPQMLGTSNNLITLILSSNNLSENIPYSLFNSSKLYDLSLEKNSLTGEIPPCLKCSSSLGFLDLSENQLSGVIPSSFGNISSLNYLYLYQNNLEGRIPESLGSLSGLITLDVLANKLHGKIPNSFYNLSSIIYIGMAQNNLSGMLLPTMGLKLPMLQTLDLQENNFERFIPHSLCNVSGLLNLALAVNGFNGMIPSCLGSLTKITYINLGRNLLHSNDMNFLSSLTNCTVLNKLILQNNKLQGELPVSIGNLSMKLEFLLLGCNQISGMIPAEIGNLVGLTVLFMSQNQFVGSIPFTIGNLSKLIQLDLSGNKLTGQIPLSIGKLTKLITLHIEDNQLNGIIPSTLGMNWNYLNELNISHNALEGSIPKEVVSLSSLTVFLDLSHNSLSGPLSFEVGNLKNLISLNVSYNQLSGQIPATIGDCVELQYLKLEKNLFTGSIPKNFKNLITMVELNLSHNNLSGLIPKFLENFTSLNYLDLSFNNFEGEVPESGIFTNATTIYVTGNKKLCGGNQILHLNSCLRGGKSSNKLKIILPTAATAVVVFILLCAICVMYRSKKDTDFPEENQPYPLVTYAEILKATKSFSDANLIGSGSFGCVYKANMLHGENELAVKVFNPLQKEAMSSFIAECQVLRNVRHRNILKILTLCSSQYPNGNDFKALVFAYMANGSLERWLQPESEDLFCESKRLSLYQRLNIAIDVASALDYLHNNCVPPIVHCDLKPSNILLDNNMTAIVSDFGLARIMSSSLSNDSSFDSTSLMSLRGSIGYVAPEYGMGSQISWQGDAYSYGIFLLEILTGKRPTDDLFVQDLNLHKYVENAFPEMIATILDPQILREMDDEVNGRKFGDHMKECMISLFQIGLTCSSESPRQRMGMVTILKELIALREIFFKSSS